MLLTGSEKRFKKLSQKPYVFGILIMRRLMRQIGKKPLVLEKA
jgi:hypothetical protein